MTDLNPRPADYKSAALPTELIQQKDGTKTVFIKNVCAKKIEKW